MSTLRHQACEQVSTLETDMKKLREFVKSEKARCETTEAQAICTTLQVQLLTVMNDCAAIRATLAAAGTCEELRGAAMAQPASHKRAAHHLDRKSLAAGEHEEDDDEPETQPAEA